MPRLRNLDGEFLHVPRRGWTAFGAQAAMQAKVLVFGHDAAGLDRFRHIDRLGKVGRRRARASRAARPPRVRHERDAIGRTNVDTGVALDARRGRENRLHIAIEATLRLGDREGRVKAEFDFGANIFQRQRAPVCGTLKLWSSVIALS